MQRIKKKFPSWEEGKRVINKISELFNLEIVEEEEFLRCEGDDVSVSCHLNPEGNAFILVKSQDNTKITKISKILQL